MVATDWTLERSHLAYLIQQHPDWSARCLAQACGHSLSWVKNWRRRILAPRPPQIPLSHHLTTQSRAPRRPTKPLLPVVINAVLSLRERLREVLQRTPGPKSILYYLAQDEVLKQQVEAQGGYLPRSTRVIWKILKTAGYIPKRIVEHQPLERAAPMSLWEMDFGQAGSGPEFLLVADQGTSIQVDNHCETHFNAESAMLSIADTFLKNGLPDRLVFDRDPRLVGSWGMDGYPSAFMRFVVCLGVKPQPTPPQRPDLKPVVERMIRTVKHEMLWVKRPRTAADARPLLTEQRQFYNRERPNQSVVCGNRPPYTAFPSLPDRPEVPAEVDPDAWVTFYDGVVFRRQADKQGRVKVGREMYSLGLAYAGQRVQLKLNGTLRCLEVLVGGTRVKDVELKGLYGRLMPFQTYLKTMLKEARSAERLQQLKRRSLRIVKRAA